MGDSLVTYDEAVLHLRLDQDTDETDVQMAIDAASEVVLKYLDRPADFFDTSGETIVAGNIPANVKKAVLFLTGVLYRDRDGAAAADISTGNLPGTVVWLLGRDPAMA